MARAAEDRAKFHRAGLAGFEGALVVAMFRKREVFEKAVRGDGQEPDLSGTLSSCLGRPLVKEG